MTKRKRIKKFESIKAHENKRLACVENLLSSFTNPLADKGLKIKGRLVWACEDGKILLERPSDQENYSGHMVITICKKEENFEDFLKEEFKHINLMTFVTSISRVTRFKILYYCKFSDEIFQSFINEIKTICNDILDQGYEAILQNITMKKNNSYNKFQHDNDINSY